MPPPCSPPHLPKDQRGHTYVTHHRPTLPRRPDHRGAPRPRGERTPRPVALVRRRSCPVLIEVHQHGRCVRRRKIDDRELSACRVESGRRRLSRIVGEPHLAGRQDLRQVPANVGTSSPPRQHDRHGSRPGLIPTWQHAADLLIGEGKETVLPADRRKTVTDHVDRASRTKPDGTIPTDPGSWRGEQAP